MPELRNELEGLLNETESQIQKLPVGPSDDAQGEVILMVSNFARELASYVEGTPDDNGIHQAIRPLNKEFVLEIRGTAQKFSPFESWRGESDTTPDFLPSEEEEELELSEKEDDDDEGEGEVSPDDTIHVDEVMVMAEK